VSDESTAVLRGQLERALAGDAEARQRLLELARDRLQGHARRLLHGRHARLEPLAQTDDAIPQPQPPPPVPPSEQWMMDGSWTSAINAARIPGATVGQRRPIKVIDP
jgi:hypothetical protein